VKRDKCEGLKINVKKTVKETGKEQAFIGSSGNW
jgi:hypothetical protein